MDDLRDEGGSLKRLLSKATGALTAEYWECDESTKKLSPLFGQGEKEEYRAAYASTAGELVVLTPKLGDFRRLYRVTPKGKALDTKDLVPVSPDVKHDVDTFALDAKRTVLTYTTNEDGYTRPHALDARTFAEKKLPNVTVRPGDKEDHVTFGASSWDGRYVVMNASAARHPTTSFVFDWKAQKLVRWVTASTPEVDTSSSPYLRSRATPPATAPRSRCSCGAPRPAKSPPHPAPWSCTSTAAPRVNHAPA